MSLSHRLPRQHHHFAARFCTAAVTAATITAVDMTFAAVLLTRISALRRRRTTATPTFSFCPSLFAATPARFHTSPPTLPPAPPPLHRRSRRSTANITQLQPSSSTSLPTPPPFRRRHNYYHFRHAQARFFNVTFPLSSTLLRRPCRHYHSTLPPLPRPHRRYHFTLAFLIRVVTHSAAFSPPSQQPQTTTNAEAHTWPSGHQFLPPSFLRYSSYRQPLPTAGTSPCYRLLRQLHYSPPHLHPRHRPRHFDTAFSAAALPSCRLA